MGQGPHGFELARNKRLTAGPGPLVLIVMDGVADGPGDAFDAAATARTPVLDRLRAEGLVRRLRAHGTAVGLPSDDDMGNSEVGHNILGAGRVFDQGAKLVERAIASGTIWDGAFAEVVAHATAPADAPGGARTLHLVGLLSDGNVHSHEKHLHALIGAAAQRGVGRLRVHVLLDGRDVPETSALIYVERLERVLADVRGAGLDYRIASGGGRMVTTMDRYEADWSIVKRGWDAHVHGLARPFPDATTAIETFRAEQPGVIDQFLPAFVVADPDGTPVGRIVDGDAVVLFNFRGDRAIEISRAFEGGPEFDRFDRGRVPRVLFAGMMLYDGDLGIPSRHLVAPPAVQKTLGEYLARNGVTQFACSETQKFGHVTYFWNGNRSGMFDPRLEEYVEVPSDRVPFEQRPWMKTAQVADQVIEAVAGGRFRFIRANLAAGDMVGHTGVFEAAVVAMQSVDLALGRIFEAVRAARGTFVVTADHGNLDDMVERDKKGNPLKDANGRFRPRTSHTLNPVPFLVYDAAGRALALRPDLPDAGLANVAATVCELLGFEPPPDFAPSLLASAP